MNDMIVNAEIKSDDVQVKDAKAYELRPLVASDMGSICKIITAIGIRQFKECFDVDQLLEDQEDKGEKKINIEKIGFNVVFDIAGIIIANIPKAEGEIQAFLSSLTGLKLQEIKKIPFADYGEMIIEVVTKEEFQDFFKRVMKLFNR